MALGMMPAAVVILVMTLTMVVLAKRLAMVLAVIHIWRR